MEKITARVNKIVLVGIISIISAFLIVWVVWGVEKTEWQYYVLTREKK
jgi:hypothetical protein